MDLKWDYKNRTCDVSMENYVTKALQKFQHKISNRKYHSPSKYTPPKYGQKIQMTQTDTSKPLTKTEIKDLQKVIGTFLFYSRAIDNTMAHALSTIASAQSSGTQKTREAMIHFLNYCATHPEATVRFRASDMILKIHF